MDAMIENMKNSFELGVKKVISSGQKRENYTNSSSKTRTTSKVFGASLSDICKRENSDVPFVVENICDYIQEKFIHVEGIFRLSASSVLTANLRQAYESHANDVGVKVDVCATLKVDAHTAANVLKQFFRRLSEPLIPDEVLNVSQKTKCLSDESFASEVRNLMLTWPDPHRCTLRRILSFLQPVIRKAENRMTTTGVAVVFAPNLFRIPPGTEGLEVQALANSTFERLLRASDVICDREKDDQGYLKMTSSSSPPIKPARVAPPIPKPARPLPPPPIPTHAPDEVLPHSPTPPAIPERSQSLIDELNEEAAALLVGSGGTSDYSDDDHTPPCWDLQSRDLLGIAIRHVVRKRLFTSGSTSSEEASPSSCERDDATTTSLLPSLTSGRNCGPRRRKPTRRRMTSAAGESMISKAVDSTPHPVPKPRRHHQVFATAVSETTLVETSESVHASSAVVTSNGSSDPPPLIIDGNRSRLNPPTNDLEFSEIKSSQAITRGSLPEEVVPPLDLTEITVSDPADLDTSSQIAPRTKEESPARIRRRKRAKKLNQVNTSPEPAPQPVIISVTHEPNDDVTDETPAPEGNSKWRDAWSTDEEAVPASTTMHNIDKHEARCSACLNNDDVHVSEKVLSSPEHQDARRQARYMQRQRRRLRNDGNRTPPQANRASKDYDAIMRSLQEMMEELNESRRRSGRPEDVTLMTRDEIKEEKLAMQKELLKYEEKHGRPSSSQDKEIMRSLYERYRTVKRLLADSMQPPFKKISERRSNDVEKLESSLEITIPPLLSNTNGTIPSESLKDVTISITEGLNVLELQHQQAVAKGEKKRLRRKLKEFENEIELQYGRKITPADKIVMASEYQGYKDLSARIRLLGALIEKQGAS